MTALEWHLYEAGHCTHPELATYRGGSLRSCQFPALVSLLRHPRHGNILFDTGYSEHFLRATAGFPERLYRMVTPVHLQPRQTLAAQLARDGIDASAIDWVVISHLHGDHVGGLADFAKASVACSRLAWQDMHSRSRLGALRVGLLPALVSQQAQGTLHWFEDRPTVALTGAFADFGQAHDLFGDASLLLVPLPGHAAGHFGALFSDARGAVFLIADASWSLRAIREGVPPPAMVTGWLGETAVYRQTLARLHALHHAAPEVRIVPSHCLEWRARKGRQPRA